MTKYSTAFPATVILSLLSSIVHGQNYSNRGERLLHTPDHFQCDSDGFHADPNDCSIFYRCIDWGESSENSLQPRYTSFKFQCGDGTVFDIESSNCVHVEETTRSECRRYVESYPFVRISERDTADSKQADYGVEQPSSGYNRPSQPPSYNRPSTDGQMPGDSGDVDNNIGESSVPPSKSPPCEEDGFFPIPNDCEHFYRCVGNGNGFNKYEFSCGPGTVWDPDNNACNHRWAVSRTDCRSESGSGGNGGSGGPEISEGSEGGPDAGEGSEGGPGYGEGSEGGPGYGEGPASPEIGEQVVGPSSSTAAPSTSTTNRPYRPSSTSGTTSRPSQTTTKKPSTTTTTTKRSTTTSSTTEVSPSSTTSTEQSSSNGTKPGNSCESEGFFPDANDCKKFYRCVDQGGKFTKYEFECAEGTVWDVQETTCNYPYAVQQSNCNSSNTESQTATTADESSSSASSTATTSAATNSQSSSSTSSSSSSSTSSYTNSSSASTSSQSSSSQTTSSSSQTASSSSQTTSSSSQTTSSQQSSSSSSTTSSQSTSSSQQTTNNQQSTGSSNNSSTSSLNGTTPLTTESPNSSNNGSQSKDDKCSEEGFFPSSKNCNKFYRCVRNEGNGFMKYEFDCGPGTVWDPENNVCNHPWAVKDERCRSGGQGTTPIGESQTSESTASSSTTESSSQSTTNNATTTTSTYSTPSQTSTTNAYTTTTAATNNTTDSSESFSSTPSNATASTTESNSGSTTTEYNANTTTTEAGCTNSTTNKPSSKIKCEKAGYYPNPDDCKKFYRCVDWDGDKGERFSVYHFNCPEGTIFDPSLNVCNHAESVYPPRNCDGSSGAQTTDSTSPDNSTTTEPTTDSSSEPTTLETTTNSANSTDSTTSGSSETTPAYTTPSEQTTTAISSTSEKGTEGTTPVTSAGTSTESTTPYTTPSSQYTTTQTTTTEISTTTTSPSSETCPELGPDQFALVCPTGFRRHPKYCNLFYQCTVSKTMDIKIVTLSCTNGTVYDEKKIQCLPPDEAQKCEGSMMMEARNLKNLGDNSASPVPVKSDKSVCPNEGSFSYKDDCRLFYKCKKDDQGKLTGYLYQCPEGFAYWSVSKRCEKMEKVPCENKKGSSTTWKSTLAPVENKNVGF